MTTTDIIEIIGIIASTTVSIVAIVISVMTLKQNSKMIEESTRPYVVVCGKTANYQDPMFYLIIKNYGSSGAIITKFICDHDLAEFSYRKEITPFKNICGTFIAPEQSFITNLKVPELFREEIPLRFQIEYKTKHRTYCENIDIVLKPFTELIQARAATKDEELKIISYTLQDLVEKHL